MAAREKRERELQAMLNEGGESLQRLKRLYFHARGALPSGTYWHVRDMIPTILEFEEAHGDFENESSSDA